jgi:hypothetical protein
MYARFFIVGVDKSIGCWSYTYTKTYIVNLHKVVQGRLATGRTVGVQFWLEEEIYFPHLSWPHWGPSGRIPWVSGAFSSGINWHVKVTTYFHLKPRLRMPGVISPLPYVIMARRYLIRQRKNCTIPAKAFKFQSNLQTLYSVMNSLEIFTGSTRISKIYASTSV